MGETNTAFDDIDLQLETEEHVPNLLNEATPRLNYLNDVNEVENVKSQEVKSPNAVNNNTEYSIDQLADMPFQRNVTATASTRSVKSTISRTSYSRHIAVSNYIAPTFFSYKTQEIGVFAKCIQQIQDNAIVPADGGVLGVWLLTEIDHWDNEREKLILLCEKSVLIVHFDFITLKLKSTKRILLQNITCLRLGQLMYPKKSLMKHFRDHGGMRIVWGEETLTWKQRWNPWTASVPYVTLAHHPMIYNEKERETAMYNMEDFYEELINAARKIFKQLKISDRLIIEEGPVVIDSYVNFLSVVYNQSRLGFYKERGGVSF